MTLRVELVSKGKENPVPVHRGVGKGKGGVEHRITPICIAHIDSLVKLGPKGLKPSMLSHPFAQIPHTISFDRPAASYPEMSLWGFE